MTPEHDPYDEHLAATGRALRAAADRHGRARPSRPLFAAGAAVAAATVLLVLLPASPGRSPVDVLGRAEAALAPKGELLHYVLRETVLDAGRLPSRICPQTGSTEVWHAPRLDRWRAVLPAAPEGPRCSVTVHGRHDLPVRGPVQLSWDAGTTATYVAANDTLDIVRGYPATSSARLVPIGDRDLGDGDPVATIRGLLAAGRLRDGGRGTLGGRRVRTLTGSRESGGVRTTVRYAVDVDTFEPVAVTTTREATDAPTTGRERRFQRFWRMFGAVTRRVTFVRYERLPLDGAGRRLLEIRPSRPPVTTNVTLPRSGR